MSYFFVVFTSIWGLFLIGVYRAISSIETLDRYLDGRPKANSKISIIIAVKDGEKEIEETLRRLVKCDYPNFEIIVVNDRSQDRTQKIIEKVKVEYANIICVQIKELPASWLGKVHALHQGIKHASGEYVLFMDADVIVSDQVLNASVLACEKNNLDHLGVLPEFIPGEFLLNVMTSTSIFLFILSAKPWLPIEKRPLESTKGVGAYNFVRRSTFEKTEGFTWLKMDVADDVALAQLIAGHGGRSQLMRAGKSKLEVSWYESFKGLVFGLEKNIVGGFTNYRPMLIFLISFVSILVTIVPLVALNFYKWPLVFYSGATSLLFTLAFVLSVKKFMKQSSLTLYFFPIGITLLGLILFRASYICFKNGGIKWSGTFYPLKDLRDGTRVKLGL